MSFPLSKPPERAHSSLPVEVCKCFVNDFNLDNLQRLHSDSIEMPGLEANGAWSVGFGFQAGAPTKAYFRNFCEAMHATHSGLGIRVINM
jgi:hypothetical protein